MDHPEAMLTMPRCSLAGCRIRLLQHQFALQRLEASNQGVKCYFVDNAKVSCAAAPLAERFTSALCPVR